MQGREPERGDSEEESAGGEFMVVAAWDDNFLRFVLTVEFKCREEE